MNDDTDNPDAGRDNPDAERLSRRTLLGLAAATSVATAAHGNSPKPAAASRANDLVMMEAACLARNIHGREISCVEVMTAYLDHIEKLNGEVNAIVALQDRGDLLAQARERDNQLARGESMGPLHGFPHAVKDLQAVKGIRSTSGSPILKDFVPSADSMMVARLRAAGAIFIGKTNTPEFGLGSHTYNPVYGATRNAYNLARSAGGSSGGAAVALALRMVPLADGSDYGGSLRNPAGWNGVYGFRTSIGRIPTDARDCWLPSMSVVGPLARTVTDLDLLLSVQAGFDARLPLSLEADDTIFQRRLEGSLRGKRIAWGRDFGGHAPCEPGVLEVCAKALRTFESLGCIVEEAIPDFDIEAVWQAVIRLRAWQQGVSLLGYYDDPAKRSLLKPEAIYEVETGLRQSAYEITAASVVRTDWYQAVRQFFERYDYFVVPTAQVFPFSIEQHWPRTIGTTSMQTYHEWMKGTLLITMSGCPALAVPAGFSEQGLPMGIQIVGPNRHELDCLRLAYAYEAAIGTGKSSLPALLTKT
jgi:amidase